MRSDLEIVGYYFGVNNRRFENVVVVGTGGGGCKDAITMPSGGEDDDQRRFGIEPHNLQCMGNIKIIRYRSSPCLVESGQVSFLLPSLSSREKV